MPWPMRRDRRMQRYGIGQRKRFTVDVGKIKQSRRT
jgi:hypothetical protein